jgi:hypothetical protein
LLLSTKLILKTSFSLDSEVLSEEEDLEVSVTSMRTHNTYLSSNQTTDSEDCRFSQRETHAEKPRKNSRRKSRKLEEEKETKSLPKENTKLKPMSEEPKNNTSRKSLLDYI